MIMSLIELRQFINTSLSDAMLESKLSAIENMIRTYTNNGFQVRNVRFKGNINGGVISAVNGSLIGLSVGDTVQISESQYNDGLYVIKTKSDNRITVDDTINENDVLITKVKYPVDVKMGVVNMLSWDIENRNKVGISSETISRHSVTYFNMDGDNSNLGYPKSVIGFLKPYMKARF